MCKYDGHVQSHMICKDRIFSVAQAPVMAATIFIYALLIISLLQNCWINRSTNQSTSCTTPSPSTALLWLANTGLILRRLINTGFHYSKLPVNKLTKHGSVALFIPGHDPPIDITVYSDVALNPGPCPTTMYSDGRILIWRAYMYSMTLPLFGL